MALHTVRGKYPVYKGEKSAEAKFRIELSKAIIGQYGRGPFNQEEIQKIVGDSLQYYISRFEEICRKETSYFFYQTVLMLHEDAIELAVPLQGDTQSSIITGEYLALYRRILKFILETGCSVPMKYVKASKADVPRIERILDDLLFLGEMIMMCVSIYAEQGMIDDVAELTFDKNDLYVFGRRHHYNFIFDHIISEWGFTLEKVVVDESAMTDLFDAVEKCLGVKFADAGHIIASIHEQMHFSDGFNWDALPANLNLLFKTPYEKAERFFKGLTLDNNNRMSLLDLACKPNNLKRYMFRPVIIWNVDGKDYAFCGKNAWSEAMIQFTTNAIPWGKGPEEWMAVKCFKEYVHRKEDDHDKWLDDHVEEILKNENCLYDRNVKKIHTKQGWINIDVEGLGEVDFIIVARDIKKIFIADCKHLMSRYDAANQKNDFNAFTKGSKKTKSYNLTMTHKLNWFKENHRALNEHFSYKYQLPDLDLTDYDIEGIFIINTPTLYMYTAEYRVYVLKQLKEVLNNTFEDKVFLIHNESEDYSSIIKSTYPYFRVPKMFPLDPFSEE